MEMKKKLSLMLTAFLLAGSISACSDDGQFHIVGAITGSYDDYSITCTIKKRKSNLPGEKGGGNKTLTAINNNGDIDIEFISE